MKLFMAIVLAFLVLAIAAPIVALGCRRPKVLVSLRNISLALIISSICGLLGGFIYPVDFFVKIGIRVHAFEELLSFVFAIGAIGSVASQICLNIRRSSSDDK